jgi:hypothetical protein
MSKKQVSMLKKLAGIALVMMLCVSLALPALADDDPKAGTLENPAQAAITKMLKMPVGTTTPTAKFTFEFLSVSVDGTPNNGSNMPGLGPIDIDFNATKTGSTEGGVKSVPIESQNIVANKTWPHAGVYKYTITEKQSTYSQADGVKEWMTYSQASYDIEVIVANDKETGALYVAYILATRKITDDGEPITDGEKVDSTPGGGDDNEYSQMIFTNIYAKTNGGGEGEPELTVLGISKTVDGLGGDQSKLFPFSVTVTKPAVGFENEAPSYKALIVGPDAPAGFITFDSGTASTVNLKHGQSLMFVDLPVGASFTVTEAAVPEYKAAYALKLDGADGGGHVNSETNTALTIASQYIGEAENTAAYTNSRTGVTPTGIIVDNLPYIVMIALTLFALAGYIAIKTRRNALDNTYEACE